MKFTFVHNNINVLDLDKSVKFYQEALGFTEKQMLSGPAGSFTLIYMTDGTSSHELELTWLRDRTEPYNLGDNEFHMALSTDDFGAAHKHHEKMGCICYENKEMGIYFISDPDGYWIEILPLNRQ